MTLWLRQLPREFFAVGIHWLCISGHSTFHVHQRRAEGNDPFLWAKGIPGAEMHGRMTVQHGNSVRTRGSIMVAQALSMGEGTGCQSTSINDADTEQVYHMILQNRQVTIDKVAHQLQISHGSDMKLSKTGMTSIKSVNSGSQSNSQNCTKRNIWTSANGSWITVVLKVTTSWKELSREMKHGPTIISQRVNTGVWNGNILIHLPKESSNCIQSTTGKLMLTVFGTQVATTGTLSGDGLNSEQCSLQRDNLKPAIWSKRRGLLSEGFVLLHDDACPHTAAHTVETLKKLNFEVLEHPLCGLDLTPSDPPVWST